MTTNELIEQVLGIPLQQSPVYTAKYLLTDCYKGQEKVIRDTTFDLRDLPFVDAARDVSWRRALESYMIGWHVHHFDKNAQYLAACSSTNTGIGDPVHLVHGDDGTFITPGLPGIYRVAWAYPLDQDAPAIDVIEHDQEWVTNDVLVYAYQKGHRFFVHEAWVFPDYGRVLGHRDDKRNWAKRLWNARQALKSVDEEAYTKMKNIALVGLGSFATGKARYSGIHLIHPNWWADTVGKARVNLLCNVEKYGVPVLIETDGLYYVSRNPDYRTAVPGILERMSQLGGYKHEGSFRLTEEIYEQARGLTYSELAKLFKRAGGEQ